MNRQIKFRAKTTANGHWVYGSLIDYGDDTFAIRNHKSQPWVQADTIGQFTGITDRNGTEIFEGDIVRISTRLENNAREASENLADSIGIQPPKWIYGGDEIARVSYFDCTFHFITMESFMPGAIGRQEPMLHYLFSERHPGEPQHYHIELEVIGNIHNNRIEE